MLCQQVLQQRAGQRVQQEVAGSEVGCGGPHAATVHREAHGLVADEIYPVAEGA
jgi:hypothetical protein